MIPVRPRDNHWLYAWLVIIAVILILRYYTNPPQLGETKVVNGETYELRRNFGGRLIWYRRVNPANIPGDTWIEQFIPHEDGNATILFEGEMIATTTQEDLVKRLWKTREKEDSGLKGKKDAP